MTSHVPQVFLDDSEWISTFAAFQGFHADHEHWGRLVNKDIVVEGVLLTQVLVFARSQ